MKQTALLLSALILSAAPNTVSAPIPESGYVYGSNHCYAFQAPAGWKLDNRLLSAHGVPMAFVPQQPSSGHPHLLIYTRPADLTDSPQNAIRQQVGRVLAQYAADGIFLKAKRLRSLRAASDATGELWRLSGHPNGGNELVVYFPARHTLNFFTAQLPAGTDTATVEQVLLQLADSYRESDHCPPCRQQHCTTTEIP